MIVLFIPENFKFSLNRIQLVPSSPISLIYIYINGRHGERRGKRSGCSPPPPPARMNKRQSVYRGIHADKSYRGSDRDACREHGGPNRDAATAPLPLPPCRGWIDGSFQRRVQRSLFSFRAFWSDQEERIADQHPFLLQPPIAVSCSISLSIHPSRSTFLLPAPVYPSPRALDSEHARRVNAPKA